MVSRPPGECQHTLFHILPSIGTYEQLRSFEAFSKNSIIFVLLREGWVLQREDSHHSRLLLLVEVVCQSKQSSDIKGQTMSIFQRQEKLGTLYATS